MKSQPTPVAWASLSPEPWRNGRGLTRTVASRSKQGRLLWRISVADIQQDGPFSTFPGLHRTAVLMAGEGLCLESKRSFHRFGNVGAAWQFDGDEEFQASLRTPSVRLWNIMVARDQMETTVHVSTGSSFVPAASLFALLLLGGAVGLDEGKERVARARQGEVLVFDGCNRDLTLVAEDDSAHWALVTIRARPGRV